VENVRYPVEPRAYFACPKPKYPAPQFALQVGLAKQWKNPLHRCPQRNPPANRLSNKHLESTRQINLQVSRPKSNRFTRLPQRNIFQVANLTSQNKRRMMPTLKKFIFWNK
jgi:hypothetical protein